MGRVAVGRRGHSGPRNPGVGRPVFETVGKDQIGVADFLNTPRGVSGAKAVDEGDDPRVEENLIVSTASPVAVAHYRSGSPGWARCRAGVATGLAGVALIDRWTVAMSVVRAEVVAQLVGADPDVGVHSDPGGFEGLKNGITTT